MKSSVLQSTVCSTFTSKAAKAKTQRSSLISTWLSKISSISKTSLFLPGFRINRDLRSLFGHPTFRIRFANTENSQNPKNIKQLMFSLRLLPWLSKISSIRILFGRHKRFPIPQPEVSSFADGNYSTNQMGCQGMDGGFCKKLAKKENRGESLKDFQRSIIMYSIHLIFKPAWVIIACNKT